MANVRGWMAAACVGGFVAVGSSAHALPVAPMAVRILAQDASSKSSSSNSGRVSGRGIGKLVKLGIGGVVLLVAGGSWAIKKMAGPKQEENPFSPESQR